MGEAAFAGACERHPLVGIYARAALLLAALLLAALAAALAKALPTKQRQTPNNPTQHPLPAAPGRRAAATVTG